MTPRDLDQMTDAELRAFERFREAEIRRQNREARRRRR